MDCKKCEHFNRPHNCFPIEIGEYCRGVIDQLRIALKAEQEKNRVLTLKSKAYRRFIDDVDKELDKLNVPDVICDDTLCGNTAGERLRFYLKKSKGKPITLPPEPDKEAGK